MQPKHTHEAQLAVLAKRVKKLEQRLTPRPSPSWPPKVSTALPL